MVEVDSPLKPLIPSILETCKVFEHIDMLAKGIQYPPYTVIPTLLGGPMSSQNDVITSWLRLTATSNRFLHPY